MDILAIGKKVFDDEIQELIKIKNKLDDNFVKVINLIAESKGKLIISGVGKSGLIGQKISATLSSTGTPSFFLNPTEAYHGDLGVVEKNDILLLISNSGESDEVLKLIPFFKDNGNKIISFSGNPNSTLAKNSDLNLNIGIENEACPLKLAPTSSTTATLVMGDALAVGLMKIKNFKEMNFAKFHPGGSLGKQLLLKVQDVMKKDNLPVATPETSSKEIISIISQGMLGIVVVIENNKICGVITDGDIRRTMEKQENNFFNLVAKNMMSKNPKIIPVDLKIVEAKKIMHQFKISSIPVVDNKNKLVGIVQIHQLNF